MRFKVAGTKRDIMGATIRNRDANSLTIKQGAPTFLKANGTEDGLAVETAVGESAATQCKFFGIALSDVAVANYGESQVFGFHDATRFRLATRAASTDVWASYPAGAIGDILAPVTESGTATDSSEADQAFSRVGSGVYSINAQVRLMESYASATTQASSIGGSSTASLTTVKTFVKTM